MCGTLVSIRFGFRNNRSLVGLFMGVAYVMEGLEHLFQQPWQYSEGGYLTALMQKINSLLLFVSLGVCNAQFCSSDLAKCLGESRGV